MYHAVFYNKILVLNGALTLAFWTWCLEWSLIIFKEFESPVICNSEGKTCSGELIRDDVSTKYFPLF